MSAKSDKFELDVVRWINRTSELAASQQKKVSEPDVYLARPGYKPTYLEVKMDHGANLINPRVFYDGAWQTNYAFYSAHETVRLLNKSWLTRNILQRLAEFAEIQFDLLKIPTTKNQFKNDPGVPHIDVMREFFDVAAENRYILSEEAYDIGTLVTKDINQKGAHYIQIGDDFYRIGLENPWNLTDDIPEFVGIGEYKVRISTRSDFCEIVPELKIWDLVESDYSVKPKTEKRNPFI